MKRSLLSLFFIAGVLILVGIGCSSAEKEGDKIKIGVMLPLSGSESVTGESIKRGIELAHKQKGLGTIELIFEDSKCEAEEAKNKLNSLIDKGVVAVIGEVCSGATLAVAPIAEERQVVLISPGTSDPELNAAGEYIFRTVPSDNLVTDFAAKYIYNRSNRRLAVLFADNEYGNNFSTALNKRFVAWGGEVVIAESFQEGSTELDDQLRKIRDARSDSIFIVSNDSNSIVAALKKVEELRLGAKIFGTQSLKKDEVILSAEGAAEDLVIISLTAGSGEFLTDHLAEYSAAPGPFAAQGYDAYMVIADTIEKGNFDANSIKDALYSVRYVGVSGNITFTEEGDIPSGNYELYQVKDGSFQKLQ